MMTPARCTSVCTQRSYVLAVCLLVFLLNQVDRYNFSVAPPEVGAPARPITPDEYAVTSGPLFTVVFTVGGVAAAHGGRGRAPVRLLAASLLLWSAATAATAASTAFWHVALARTVQGLGESGCSPFAVAVISGYFAPASRATALGVYNIGIYAGYSMALSLGSVIKESLGWQAGYLIFGGVGALVAVVIVLTVPEPAPEPPVARGGVTPSLTVQQLLLQQQQHDQRRPEAAAACDDDAAAAAPHAEVAAAAPSAREVARYWLHSPALLLLCVAGGVRNAGGYVWAYYAAPFFMGVRGVPPATFQAFMAWIPLLAGSCGAVLGGYVSDAALRARPGDGSATHRARVRLGVVAAGVAASVPFAAVAVLADIGTSGLALLPLLGASLFGEMWIGVTMTVAVEAVAPRMRPTCVAIYLFIITNIAGNAPLLVPAITASCGMQTALGVLYVGAYLASVPLFLATMLVLRPAATSSSGGGAPSTDAVPLLRQRPDARSDDPCAQAGEHTVTGGADAWR